MIPSIKYTGLPSWLDAYALVRLQWNGVEGYFGILPVSKISANKGQVPGLPANPRRWTSDELDRLKKSLAETPELTLARGVLAYPADTGLVTLGGNMRLHAAKSLKEKTLPVFVFPAETSADKLMEIVAKDNGSFGEWDFDALANEWSDKPLVDWGVPAWEQRNAENAENGGEGGSGGSGEQHQCEDREDNTDGMEVEKRASVGAVFRLGHHVVMCGDATDPAAYDALLGAARVERADLALTDPPYGISVVPKSGKLGGMKTAEKEIDRARRNGLGSPEKCAVKVDRPVIGDATTDTARAAFDILKDRSAVQVVFGGNYFTDFLPPSRCWIVWDKGVPDGFSFADVELAWASADRTARLFRHTWIGVTREGDHAAEGSSRLHPTQKPVGLLTAVVEKLFPDVETLLDPFGGSGSTLIAAERLGKRCLLMELSPEYVDVILARWERFTGSKAERVDNKTV